MREYAGFWSTGFGVPYFTPCGLDESWYADGLPGYEVCDPDPFYLRVLGIPYGVDSIEVVEILEGPCTGGSCDGSVPGDPCVVEAPYSGFDDCALGSVCWDVDPVTLQGECVALCDQSLDPDPACSMGTSCTSIFAAADPAGVCF